MSYQLSRLRLASIGERAARFPDVTLDLSSPDGAEPLDSIVWLRNGGGKSSLLSLFFALVLPMRRDFLGLSMKRYIEDYIADGDTSHSAAEWVDVSAESMFPGSGPRLVTGAVYEWDERRKPADPDRNRDKLKVSYYTFFATDGVLTLDTLPVRGPVGRPTTRADFVRQLRELGAEHPQQLQLVITDQPTQWMTTLSGRNLDPELFRYQKKMNHSEGGVADLFNFDTSAKFIDFLIDLTIDSGQPDRVAANLRAVADVLASKPRHLLGREFCDTLVGKLDALAAEHEQAELASADAGTARVAAAALSAQLAASAAHHNAAQTAIDTQLRHDEELQVEGNRQRNQLTALANELLLRAARFRAARCTEELSSSQEIAAARNRDVTAWEAVGPLAEQLDAHAQAEQVTRLMVAEEQRNQPRRDQRDAAALALQLRYTSLAGAEQDALSAAELAGQQAATRSTELRAEQRERNREHARVGAELVGIDRQLRDIDAAVATAVRAGDLPAAGSDVAAHRVQTAVEQAQARVEREDARTRRTERNLRRTAIGESRSALAGAHATASSEREQLQQDHSRLSDRARTLATDRRLAALTQIDDGQSLNLWAEAAVLRAALTRAAADSDAAIVNSGVDAAEDVRALAALESEGYLPTTRDSERVAGALAGAGLSARPGWELLRDLLEPHDRKVALTQPHVAALASGLVVADADAGTARQVLTALDSVAHVPVSTPTTFEQALRDGTAAWDVVAPTAALYEPYAADVARTERTERAALRTERDRAWAEQARTDRELLAILERFLADCPSGHLAALHRDIAAVDVELGRLRREQKQLADELGGLEEADTADRDLESELTDQVTSLGERMQRLDGLAARTATVPALQESRTALEGQQSTLDITVAELEEQAGASEATERALTEQAAAHRATLSRYADQAAAITLLGGTAAADSAEQAVDDDPAPLATLVTRFSQAERDWEQVAAQSVLAERLRTQKEREGSAARRLGTFDKLAREAAAALLRTPDGQDEQRRELALSAARTAQGGAAAAVTRAEGFLCSAQDEVAAAESVLERGRRGAELDTEPADEAHARELAGVAAAAATQKSEELTARGRDMEQARLEQAEQKRIAGLFGQYVSRLAYAAPDEPPVAPDVTPAAVFDGTHEQADARVTRTLEELAAANSAAGRAAEKVRSAANAVRRVAGDARFSTLESPLKERFISDEPTVLAQMAASRAVQLRARSRQIDGMLADIGTDQKLVVTQVATLVAEVLSTLSTAQRHSRLPGSLGDWSNQQFLTISFSKPATDEDLRARIDAVIDQVVAEQSKPEGLALLKKCVHEAVAPRGFRVTVLKPNSDLDVEPLDITLLGKYSGGEKLTVCVALYCTLARLRAVNRGQGHVGGTLVLDNPLGTASHIALLRLQRDVAAAHGVQLVYTTGVEDLGAVGQFPNVLRLRNSAGSLRHRRYVTVDARTVDGAPVDEPDDGIRAARVSSDRAAG